MARRHAKSCKSSITPRYNRHLTALKRCARFLGKTSRSRSLQSGIELELKDSLFACHDRSIYGSIGRPLVRRVLERSIISISICGNCCMYSTELREDCRR